MEVCGGAFFDADAAACTVSGETDDRGSSALTSNALEIRIGFLMTTLLIK
jgi:hypothetical protein